MTGLDNEERVMERKMPYGALKFGAYMGPLAATFIGVALWPLMHIFPPLGPSLPPAEIAAFIEMATRAGDWP